MAFDDILQTTGCCNDDFSARSQVKLLLLDGTLREKKERINGISGSLGASILKKIQIRNAYTTDDGNTGVT